VNRARRPVATDLPGVPGPAAPPPRLRIDVRDDPRDLPGDFPHRLAVDVRFGDTDAMGHVNNARFLTYCESARISYWEEAMGEAIGLPTHGAEDSLILADIDVAFRTPAFFGETLTVETRIGRTGRTSATLEHRITAAPSESGPARLVATATAVVVLYDYATASPRPVPDRMIERLEAFEGRPLRS
jgi:acyl-CoA thioester hydrolase